MGCTMLTFSRKDVSYSPDHVDYFDHATFSTRQSMKTSSVSSYSTVNIDGDDEQENTTTDVDDDDDGVDTSLRHYVQIDSDSLAQTVPVKNENNQSAELPVKEDNKSVSSVVKQELKIKSLFSFIDYFKMATKKDQKPESVTQQADVTVDDDTSAKEKNGQTTEFPSYSEGVDSLLNDIMKKYPSFLGDSKPQQLKAPLTTDNKSSDNSDIDTKRSLDYLLKLPQPQNREALSSSSEDELVSARTTSSTFKKSSNSAQTAKSHGIPANSVPVNSKSDLKIIANKTKETARDKDQSEEMLKAKHTSAPIESPANFAAATVGNNHENSTVSNISNNISDRLSRVSSSPSNNSPAKMISHPVAYVIKEGHIENEDKISESIAFDLNNPNEPDPVFFVNRIIASNSNVDKKPMSLPCYYADDDDDDILSAISEEPEYYEEMMARSKTPRMSLVAIGERRDNSTEDDDANNACWLAAANELVREAEDELEVDDGADVLDDENYFIENDLLNEEYMSEKDLQDEKDVSEKDLLMMRYFCMPVIGSDEEDDTNKLFDDASGTVVDSIAFFNTDEVTALEIARQNKEKTYVESPDFNSLQVLHSGELSFNDTYQLPNDINNIQPTYSAQTKVDILTSVVVEKNENCFENFNEPSVTPENDRKHASPNTPLEEKESEDTSLCDDTVVNDIIANTNENVTVIINENKATDELLHKFDCENMEIAAEKLPSVNISEPDAIELETSLAKRKFLVIAWYIILTLLGYILLYFDVIASS